MIAFVAMRHFCYNALLWIYGAISTWRHAGGRFAMVSDVFGFAGSVGGAGCSTSSENQ